MKDFFSAFITTLPTEYDIDSLVFPVTRKSLEDEFVDQMKGLCRDMKCARWLMLVPPEVQKEPMLLRSDIVACVAHDGYARVPDTANSILEYSFFHFCDILPLCKQHFFRES